MTLAAVLVLNWLSTNGYRTDDTGSAILAPLRTRSLRFLGSISYGTYLYHLPILIYAPTLLGRIGVHGAFQAAGVCVLVIAVPIASWFFMEQPLLNLQKRRAQQRLEAPQLALKPG